MYLSFELEVIECPVCKTPMMNKDKLNLFSRVWGKTQEEQMKKLGVVFRSRAKIDDEYICVNCQKQGKASFFCALCHERKPSDKLHESYGYPPEYLCTDCYRNVPAEVWDKKIEELYDSHRWDYE